jgi:cytochrome c556
MNMKKHVVPAGLLLLLGTITAFAGPVEDRQAIMKSFDPAEAVIRRMVAPGGTLDLAAARPQLQVFVDGATKFPSLFPAGSDATGPVRTAAAPVIWTDSVGFQAAATKLVTDAKAGQAATDQASFTTAWQAVESDCGGCHRTYRVRLQRPAGPPPAPPAQ